MQLLKRALKRVLYIKGIFKYKVSISRYSYKVINNNNSSKKINKIRKTKHQHYI